MTMLPQGSAALHLQSHRSFSSQRMPSTWPRRLAAAACAMLCTAHCSGGAAASLSSAAHTALSAHTARNINNYAVFIEDASARFHLPPAWIRAVIAVESRGDAQAISPKGAIGLMQLMPATWATLRDRYHLGTDPFDPYDNIVAGAAYLRELFDRFGQAGFLAAYNVGPGRLKRHMLAAQSLPGETIRYLAALGRLLPDLHFNDIPTDTGQASDWRTAGLFVSAPTVRGSTTPSPSQKLSDNATTASHFALAPHANGLFAASVPVDSR